MRLSRSILFALSLLVISNHSYAQQIHVAVASNFTGAMTQLAAAFEKNTGNKVILSFGSSGKFYGQIQHGAPFDVFFSADEKKPIALEKAGLTVKSSRFTYATGAVALWSATPGLIDGTDAILKSNQFNKLALANPRLAPYGVAAVEVLDNLKLVDATKNKWVQGENISQTFQFVNSGNADIGFVALSQIIKDGRVKSGSAWLVPAKLYKPIRQDAVLLKTASDNQAAKQFLAFIKTSDAANIIKAFGYSIPQP